MIVYGRSVILVAFEGYIPFSPCSSHIILTTYSQLPGRRHPILSLRVLRQCLCFLINAVTQPPISSAPLPWAIHRDKGHTLLLDSTSRDINLLTVHSASMSLLSRLALEINSYHVRPCCPILQLKRCRSICNYRFRRLS